LSNGYINIEPSQELAPFTFSWTGPGQFSATTEDISGLRAGQYTMLIIDRNNCPTRDTFNLRQPQKLSMTIEPSVSRDGEFNIDCNGAQTGWVNVSAVNNIGRVDYLWADGYLGSRRPDMSAGTYKILLVDSNNCHADSTVTLEDPEPIRITFDVTDPFCPDSPDGEIRTSVSGGISGSGYFYLWPNGSTGSLLPNVKQGWYAVRVTDANGCTVTDSVRLEGMNKQCLIIPDAFSPNRDLVNDVWNIEHIDLYPAVEITIYNRWGQLLWQSEPGYPVPWNGRSRGEDLPIDSYHYFIDLKNSTKPLVGDVTIVR
jgi:gliding motility-associated-like protein